MFTDPMESYKPFDDPVGKGVSSYDHAIDRALVRIITFVCVDDKFLGLGVFVFEYLYMY